MRARTFIGLLRGINVGGHNRIPMAELRAECAGLGWGGVQTYIQSGNIIFGTDDTAAGAAEKIEQLIARRFGLAIPVIVRSARDWPTYVRGNPFVDASRSEPNLVLLGLSRSKPQTDAADALRERASHGERVVFVGDALWIHFARGVAKSKLTPSLLDRLVGSPVTMRNWRTVVKLDELAQSASGTE